MNGWRCNILNGIKTNELKLYSKFYYLSIPSIFRVHLRRLRRCVMSAIPFLDHFPKNIRTVLYGSVWRAAESRYFFSPFDSSFFSDKHSERNE